MLRRSASSMHMLDGSHSESLWLKVKLPRTLEIFPRTHGFYRRFSLWGPPLQGPLQGLPLGPWGSGAPRGFSHRGSAAQVAGSRLRLRPPLASRLASAGFGFGFRLGFSQAFGLIWLGFRLGLGLIWFDFGFWLSYTGILAWI